MSRDKTYFSYHNHTDYSNIRGLDSINKVNSLISYAIKLGLEGVAITDHECLSGHYKALKYIEKIKRDAKNNDKLSDEEKKKIQDFKLVLGNEIYLVRDGLCKENYVAKEDGYYHFILLAKDEIGHEQLRELSSRAWLRSYRQFIERVPTYYCDIEEIVGKNPGHLIATSACLGGFLGKLFERITEAEKKGNEENAKHFYNQCVNFCRWAYNIFQGEFYLELQPSDTKDQISYNNFLVKLAKATGLRCTIATDSHYEKKADRPIHKAYLNASDSEREVDAFYSSTYLMSVEEIYEYMDKEGRLNKEQINEMLDNTLNIMNQCKEYTLAHKPIVPKCMIPNYISPYNKKDFEDKEYISKYFNSDNKFDNYLIYLIMKGIDEKVPKEKHEKYYDRVEKELKELWNISLKLNDAMSAYLLIVREIEDIIWKKGDSLIGPSRGSAMGFVINYLIDITQIDPLTINTPAPWWRFLNSERVSLPDVDIDTQGMKREQIVKALKEYYGEYRAINVGTFKTEKAKSAMLTSMRGLEYDVDYARYISSMIPVERGQIWELHECYYGNPEKDRAPVTNFVAEMNQHPDIWEVVQKVEGLICGRSSHAGGVIIVNEDFTKHNALMRTPKGTVCSQYELHDSEDMGR